MADDVQEGELPENTGVETEKPASKDLPPAALRALKEAEERRAAQAEEAGRAKELGGPKGAEPTRYGDWERKGRAVDF